MTDNDFKEKVDLFRDHVDRLNHMIDMLPEPQKDILAKAFQGFTIALEELQVAEEELHQQNEQLIAAQHEMLAERQRYLDLFEFAPNSYLVTNEAGIIQEANHNASKLLKHTQKGLVGKPLAIFISLSERRIFHKWLSSLIQDSSPQEKEFTIDPPQGPLVPVLTTAAGFQDPSNGQLRLHWMLHDISARVEANKLLVQTASRVQLLEAITSAANASNNIEQLLNFALERICEHTGWPVGHVYLRHDQPDPVLIPTTIWHLDDPEIFAAFRQATEHTRFGPDEGLSGRVLSNCKPEWVSDLTQIHGYDRLSIPENRPLKSGLFFPVLAGEEVAAVLEFFTEETLEPEAELQDLLAHIGEQLGRVFERVHAEQQLRESEARFRMMFDDAALGIDLVDMQGNIVEANPTLQEMLGYSSEEIRHMNFGDLTHPDDIEESHRLFQELVNGKRDKYRVEKRYLHKDGSVIWTRLSVSLFGDRYQGQRYAMAMIENFTKQKLIQDELAEVERRLIDSREAERLQLAQELHDGPVQDLLAISYQFNNLQEVFQDENQLLQFNQSYSMLQQVMRTLRGICGELRPPTLTPFGLEKAIRSHVAQIEEARQEISIDLELMNDGKTLPERVRLALFRIYQQAVLNVLRHANASKIYVQFQFNDENVKLKIQDDGKGFHVPERPVELVRQGHFGLVGSAERAQAIGGKLWIESEIGQGTTVSVIVPRQAQEYPYTQGDGIKLRL
jgi:PAS domain S-box-containing protein